MIPGWTILAQIDNSVDDRPGSNAEFLAEGQHTLEDMIAMAWVAFPEIVTRLNWPSFE